MRNTERRTGVWIAAGVPENRFAVPLGIFHLIQLIRGERSIQLMNVLLMLGMELLFTIPYVGWALNILPRYNTALIMAIVTAMIAAAGGVYIGARVTSQTERTAQANEKRRGIDQPTI